MSDPLRLRTILAHLPALRHRPKIWPEPMRCTCGCETLTDIDEEETP